MRCLTPVSASVSAGLPPLPGMGWVTVRMRLSAIAGACIVPAGRALPSPSSAVTRKQFR